MTDYIYSIYSLPVTVALCYLLVDLGELFQVVLQEGDLLFLGHIAKSLLTVQLCALKNRFRKTVIHMNTTLNDHHMCS